MYKKTLSAVLAGIHLVHAKAIQAKKGKTYPWLFVFFSQNGFLPL